MKSLLASKRSKAILGIGIVAIGIGAISKKVISYPAGGCMKGTQEMTFNKEINISVPLVVRLAGTNFKEGKEILKNSGLKIIPAENLDDAAKKIVEAIR